MKLRSALPLALLATLAVACSGDAKIREDVPEHLVEDLARAFRADAIEWLDEENAVTAGPAGMGVVASQDVSASVIRFQRLLESGRALCDRWLPRETNRTQVPTSWHPRLRELAVALALAAPEEISAGSDESAGKGERRVTLRVGEQSWNLRLRPVKKSWVFSSALRRQD